MAEQSTEITVVSDANALLQAWGFGGAQSRFHTSINGTEPADQAAKLRLLNSEGVDFISYLNRSVSVVGYMLRPAQKVDPKSGEVSAILLCMILLDNGDVLKSTSPYVVRDLLDAATMFGLPTRDKPFVLIPRTRGKPPQQSHWLDSSPMTDGFVGTERKSI